MNHQRYRPTVSFSFLVSNMVMTVFTTPLSLKHETEILAHDFSRSLERETDGLLAGHCVSTPSVFCILEAVDVDATHGEHEL